MRPEFKTMHMVTKGKTLFFKYFTGGIKILHGFFGIFKIKGAVFMGDPGAHHIFGAQGLGAGGYLHGIFDQLFVAGTGRWDADPPGFAEFSEIFRGDAAATALDLGKTHHGDGIQGFFDAVGKTAAESKGLDAEGGSVEGFLGIGISGKDQEYKKEYKFFHMRWN